MKRYYFQLSTGTIINTDSPDIWRADKGARELPKAEGERLAKAEAHKQLRASLKPGDTVYTILRHVAKSGMMRHIDVFTIRKNRLEYLTGYVATLCGYSRTSKNEIISHGAGQDMGYEIVYNLGAALWPKGTSKPHGTRNGKPDSAGGYALRHQWI
jgi:hypothetical protein